MKKIAVSTVRAFLKSKEDERIFDVDLFVGEDAFTVHFDFNLTLDEHATFVRRVLSGCYDALGNYRPEYFHPMLNATVLQMCSNAPTLNLKGEKMEDNTPALDVGAMHDFFRLIADDINTKVFREDSKEFKGFWDCYWELEGACVEARDWKNGGPLRDVGALCQSLNDTLDAVQQIIYKIADKADEIDMDALTTGVRTLADAADSMQGENMAEALLKVYDGGKAQSDAE